METAIPVALVVDFRALQAAITRMSSPGFQWRVRGLVRAALLDDSGQTNACCAFLGAPTRGPERLEGCAQPPHQQERTRPEVAGSARHQAAATRSESVKSTDRYAEGDREGRREGRTQTEHISDDDGAQANGP